MGRELQPYWIPHHVRAASMDDATVLLDLKRNRYFGVGVRETRALCTVVPNWRRLAAPLSSVVPMTLEEASPIADKLVDAGLLSRSAPQVPWPDGEFASERTIELDGRLRSAGCEVAPVGRVRLRDCIHFVRACVWARRSLRTHSLYDTLQEVALNKRSASAAFDEGRTLELIEVFRRLRPFAFTSRDQCLFHALALVKFLSYYRIFPTWVIGVKVRPWAAHSWVQEGALILDGNPEHICEYTPILTA